LDKGKRIDSGTRVTSNCVAATSMLPSPPPDTRIFLAVGGALHVVQRPGTSPEPLPGIDRSLRLTSLLAFRAAASPLQLLAAALPEGAAEEELWSITVSDATVLGAARVTDDPAFAHAQAFFAGYNAPRCLPGGRRCLMLSRDDQQTYVDIKPTRDARPQTVQELGGADIVDITWGPGEEATFYLLVGCSCMKSPCRPA
jgi:hypothetical protein